MGLRKRWLSLWILASAATAAAHDFVGPDSCKSCHPDAFLVWRQTKHARAKDSLSPAQQKDARCLTCHSPDEASQDQAVRACSCPGAPAPPRLPHG